MPSATVNSVTLHYRLTGPEQAPGIVFSNAFGTDLRIWDGVVAALGDRYRILRYDTRGHGQSENPDTAWGMQDNVHDLAALMEHLGFSDTAVCGLSLGGIIAQGLAAERPDLVRLLILSNTAVKVGAPNLWARRIEHVLGEGMQAACDSILERWFPPAVLQSAPQVALVRDMVLNTPATGYAHTCQALADTDLYESTARLRLPSMAIAGGRDRAVPADMVRETAGLIAGCRFEVLHRSGHLPCVDAPDQVAALLTDFLSVNGHA